MVGMNEYVFVSKKIIESVGFSDENAKSRRAVAEKFWFLWKLQKFISFDPYVGFDPRSKCWKANEGFFLGKMVLRSVSGSIIAEN